MASPGDPFVPISAGAPGKQNRAGRALFWTRAETGRLAAISGFLQEALSREGPYRDNPDERYLVELAVIEACTNVIRYAYGPGSSGKLGLFLRRTGSGLEILILDQGAPFDPTRVAPPDLTAPKEGGYGIFLMRQIMTEVRYARRGSRWNCLLLARDDPQGSSTGQAETCAACGRPAGHPRGRLR